MVWNALNTAAELTITDLLHTKRSWASGRWAICRFQSECHCLPFAECTNMVWNAFNTAAKLTITDLLQTKRSRASGRWAFCRFQSECLCLPFAADMTCLSVASVTVWSARSWHTKHVSSKWQTMTLWLKPTLLFASGLSDPDLDNRILASAPYATSFLIQSSLHASTAFHPVVSL